MKRLLILALVLLLTACGREDPAQTTEATGTTVPETTGLYVPESEVELATDGVVRAYQLEGAGERRLYAMGNKLLLRTGDELSVLVGQYADVTATMPTGSGAADSLLDISALGIAYLDQKTNQVVIRNPQLLEVQRVDLPEDCQGAPLVSLTVGELFYVSGMEIRALNLETGISRLIKSQNCQSQTLTGCWFDGRLLSCEVVDESGQTRVIYVSTETGRTLSEDQGIYEMYTAGDWYFVRRMDGNTPQNIFGTMTGKPQLFCPPSATASSILFSAKPVPQMYGAVELGESDLGVHLVFSDFATGKTGGQVLVPGITQPTDICSDGTYLWFLAYNADGEQLLYRWDVGASKDVRPAPCTGPLYTAEDPDTEGLAMCQKQVQLMNETYAVRISIWQDALEYAGDLEVTPEYQTGAIVRMLSDAEPILEQFPKDFLRRTVEGGWIRICLVRALPDGKSWVQTWVGGDCCIFLTPEADIQAALLQGIGYGVDSHVLGNSRDFDTWNALNPTGFAYTGDGEITVSSAYLEGSNRYFVDAAAATYPHMDRCSIFCQAMLPDNLKLFAAPPMQAKLLRLCQGIREAYGLEKSTDTYVWEQYLTKSLAPEE